MDFPSQHWLKIQTNNVIERMNREIRRRTRVVGTFPDGKSALMLVCARLRYVLGKEWGSKRYLCMKYLTEAATEGGISTAIKRSVAAPSLGYRHTASFCQKRICEKLLTVPQHSEYRWHSEIPGGASRKKEHCSFSNEIPPLWNL